MALKTCRNSKNLITNRSRERPLILGQLAKGRNYSVYYEYLYEDQDEQMYLNRRRALIGYSQGNNLLNPNGRVLMRHVLCRWVALRRLDSEKPPRFPKTWNRSQI